MRGPPKIDHYTDGTSVPFLCISKYGGGGSQVSHGRHKTIKFPGHDLQDVIILNFNFSRKYN